MFRQERFIEKSVLKISVRFFLAPPAGLDTYDESFSHASSCGARFSLLAESARTKSTAAPCRPHCIIRRMRSDSKLPPEQRSVSKSI